MDVNLKSMTDFLIQKEHYKISCLADSQNNLKWIPMIQCWEDGGSMGISQNYEWVVEGNAGLYILSSTKSFLFVKVFLERPLDNVLKDIKESLSNYHINKDPINLFPYFQIIKAVFEDSSVYWAELALEWYDELPTEKKMQLKDSLEKIKTAKWASQKLRHKAMKEIAKLNR